MFTICVIMYVVVAFFTGMTLNDTMKLIEIKEGKELYDSENHRKILTSVVGLAWPVTIWDTMKFKYEVENVYKWN